jgi:hypothetical protein
MDWNRATAAGMILLVLCIAIAAVVTIQMQRE